MVIYENVTNIFGGFGKVVKKKTEEGDHIRMEEKRYFLGIKYKEVSQVRKSGLMDAWSGFLGINH